MLVCPSNKGIKFKPRLLLGGPKDSMVSRLFGCNCTHPLGAAAILFMNTSVDARLMLSNRIVNMTFIARIVPLERIPNGMSGVFLGQAGLIDCIVVRQIPREILIEGSTFRYPVVLLNSLKVTFELHLHQPYLKQLCVTMVESSTLV
jgi:hypothetical protein